MTVGLLRPFHQALPSSVFLAVRVARLFPDPARLFPDPRQIHGVMADQYWGRLPERWPALARYRRNVQGYLTERPTSVRTGQ